MSAQNMDTFDAALKEHYTDERIYNMVYANNPLLALMPKYEQFGGRNLPVPIIFANPQGRSATFSTAKANKTPSKITQYTLTRVKDYSLASVDNETLEASRGNPNAFMEALATEVDGAIQAATRSLAVAMYGDKSGAIGVVASSEDVTDTITLVDPENITNFEVGMQIVFNENKTDLTPNVVICLLQALVEIAGKRLGCVSIFKLPNVVVIRLKKTPARHTTTVKNLFGKATTMTARPANERISVVAMRSLYEAVHAVD